ncbi:MAG: hypothetical protein V4596_06215 [Bdellovibrionota bacterium]
MKTVLFTILILILALSSQSYADGSKSCASLFQEDLIMAKESQVFAFATNYRMEDIEPNLHKLELYEGGSKKEVHVGDFVSITFKESIVADMPTTTGSVEGYMLGTRKMIDPESGEAQLYYFILNPKFNKGGIKSADAIFAFTLENVEPFDSKVRKDMNYRSRSKIN